MTRLLEVLLLLTPIWLISGCSDFVANNTVAKTAPVSGKLMNGDSPVANAKILMLPLRDTGDHGPARWSYATTNEEGRFTMRFNTKKYGAHAGENLVLISTEVRQEIEEGNVVHAENDGEKDARTETTDELEEKGNAAEKAKEKVDVEKSPNPEVKLLENIKQALDKPEPWTQIQKETVPDVFNRRSQLTFNVLPEGNSSVVIQIGSAAVKAADSIVAPSEDLATPKS